MSETHENLAKLRRPYTAAYKLKILRAVEVQGLQAVVEATNISKETIRKWNSQALMTLPTKAKRSPGAGRPCEKLPILFIIKGERVGYLEQDELREYPQGHLYFVQKNAWMDNEGWKYFLRELMRSEVRGPTLFVVDNFAAHVSDDSVSIVEEELSFYLCPLPKNCTSVLQP
ncbi:hypothetical protein AeRB84_013706 [Aphanomyces euteiches]|nr:hypothetical protein AeRB84_013706 [Aphanomyces euteiches]